MGHIYFNHQPKYKWPLRISFAVAGLSIAAALWWSVENHNEAVRTLTPDQQVKIKSDTARNPSFKNGDASPLKESAPDATREAESGQTSNAWVDAAKPKEISPQEIEDKEVMNKLAKDLYEELLIETDPITRYNKIALIKAVTNNYPDALSTLGMTKDRVEGLVRSLQVQAGPVALDNVRKMDKYDSVKVDMVVTLIEIANSLSSGDRGRYYESLGSSRSEMQNHYCDGVVATARQEMAFALSTKADKMIYNDYTYRFMSYIESLAKMMPDGYSKVCEAAGRNVYQESGISNQQIQQLLKFKPEIIPE